MGRKKKKESDKLIHSVFFDAELKKVLNRMKYERPHGTTFNDIVKEAIMDMGEYFT